MNVRTEIGLKRRDFVKRVGLVTAALTLTRCGILGSGSDVPREPKYLIDPTATPFSFPTSTATPRPEDRPTPSPEPTATPGEPTAIPEPTATPTPTRDEGPPNIVFIVVDDMGWKDVGFNGNTTYHTPNLDRLAAQGMVFTDAYSNSPVCAPSRASYLTGLYGPRHGVYTVGSPVQGKPEERKLVPAEHNQTLESQFVTIAEGLKPAKYATAMIGKWHPNNVRASEQGFDVQVTPKSLGFGLHGTGYCNPRIERGEVTCDGEYLPDVLTDHTVEFMDANKNVPFFLYLSHNAPHSPLQPRSDIYERYTSEENAEWVDIGFAAIIESIDQSVGRIMDKLDDLNLTDNTLLVFFSDNGARNVVTDNLPLRGEKGTMYEGGIRVPLVMRWPEEIGAGARTNTPVIGTDFFPTFLEVAGVESSENVQGDGESMLQLMKGGSTLDRDAIFWHFPMYLEAGAKDWLVKPWSAIRTGDYKLIEFLEDGELELYNLREDISEITNLVDEMPEKAEELHKLLVAWRISVDARVPIELNPDYDPEHKPRPVPKPDLAHIIMSDPIRFLLGRLTRYFRTSGVT